MADSKKNRGFSTIYESEDAGMLAFEQRDDIMADIVLYLELVQQLKKDFHEDDQVVEGLGEIEMKLNGLRISTDDKEVLDKKLAALVQVPVSSGKTIHLEAFRKSAVKATLADNQAYREHVRKLVRNTGGNITQLLLTWPDDGILLKFQEELRAVDLDGDIGEIKIKMKALGKSPQLWHYNDKKKEFLVEWLRPFQEHFGKSVEELTGEELHATIQKVENLRNEKLEEMTHLELETDRDPFKEHNRRMHAIMNGKNLDFWGSAEVRDEFIVLMNKLLTRFTLNLEDRFLLFKTKDSDFAYLVGFADDAFDQAVETQDGKLAIFPHLKVFIRGEGGHFGEISQDSYPGDSSAYFNSLKTAAVPFLVSMGEMVETPLSNRIKEAFEMWI